jgi:hypothetical protein
VGRFRSSKTKAPTADTVLPGAPHSYITGERVPHRLPERGCFSSVSPSPGISAAKAGRLDLAPRAMGSPETFQIDLVDLPMSLQHKKRRSSAYCGALLVSRPWLTLLLVAIISCQSRRAAMSIMAPSKSTLS